MELARFSPVLEAIHAIMPPMQADLISQLELHPHTDLSRSNRCHHLTHGMQQALAARGLAARRELHQTATGHWHYLLAHAPVDEPPTETDIITDLNPWQFDSDRLSGGSGLLHASRREVQTVLTAAGAPEWFVSLRGLETIVAAHTMLLTPFSGAQR